MSTKHENEPNDEQLDAMLRCVSIPPDLKSRLMQIPDSPSTLKQGDDCPPAVLPAQTTQAGTSWVSYVLVASLLVVTALATAHLYSKDRKSITPESVASNDAQESGAKPDLQSAEPVGDSATSELESRSQELQMLQAEIEELEIARLEAELIRLTELNDKELRRDEVESMIIALAAEHSVPLGGNKADVRFEMARVLRDYPGTQGAVLANNILNRID